MTNRSQFLTGSPAAVVGAPLLAFPTAARAADDPVLVHIVKEFTRLNDAVVSRAVVADDYRAAAANFRLFAAHLRAHDLDRRLREDLRALIRRKGRKQSIDEALQKAATEHHAGMDHPTYEKLERSLERVLLQMRVSDQMEAIAGQLSVVHGVMLKRAPEAAGGGVIVRTQTAEELEHAIRCRSLNDSCSYWQDQVTLWCFASMITTVMCVGMQLSASMYCGLRDYYGCR